MDCRVKPTSVWHGVCLSCRLGHGDLRTAISASSRRAGCRWPEVKSGLLSLGHWRGLKKFSDGSAKHQICLDEPGEGKQADSDSVGVVSQAQQQKGDECNRDLDANGVFRCSEEVADLQGLLDPSKEQFDGPSTLVQVRDVLRACLQIIGEDAQHLAGLDYNPNFADESRHRVVAG